MTRPGGRAALAAQGPSPRVRVAAVVPRERGILLVQHSKDGRSYHLLPGGGVEAGESLAAALVREVREETGLECEPLAPLFLNDSIDPDGARHVIQITFLVKVIGGTLTDHPADERVVGTIVVPLADLASLDLRPPMAEALVEASAAGYAAPARYLGPLWSGNDPGATGTDGRPTHDG